MLHTNGFVIDTVTTNRIKPINWLYLPWAPVQFGVSWLAFRRGAKTETHKQQIAATLRQMMCIPILLGESTILVATAQR